MSADGARKLFVGGLADSATEVDLRAVFQGAGFEVQQLALPRDRETGRLRGFAFITLANEQEAARARAELQGADCAGRPLSIREFSQEPPKRATPGERPVRQEEPTVFLGKLPFDSTPEEIQALFVAQGAGVVTRVTLPLGPDGRPRGFGFATLSSPDQVDVAVAKVNGASLRGRQIVVSPAQPRGAGAGGGAPGGRDAGTPYRGAPRNSDRPGEGFGGFGFEGPEAEPPPFPPAEARGGGRRREVKRDKRGGAAPPEKRRGGGDGQAEGAPRGSKRRRGGGANWHQWESDDD